MRDFDHYYLHLVLWHKGDRQVAGAYRLGATPDILPSMARTAFTPARCSASAATYLTASAPMLSKLAGRGLDRH
jgi:hypothetical protein